MAIIRVSVIRTTTLAVLVLLSLGAAAADDYARCQQKMQKIVDDILDDARRIEEKHSEKLEKILTRFERQSDLDARTIELGRSAIDRLIERSGIDDARAQLIDDLIGQILEIGELTPEFKCPKRRYRGANSTFNVKRYSTVLENLREEVEDRLALESLRPDEGLAIIALYSHGRADRISINRLGSLAGDIHFGPVNNSEYFRVIKVKAGEYRWEKLRQDFFNLKYIYDVKHRDMTFTVEAGKLNYTGVVIFDPSGRRARLSLNDRTSIVLLMLQQRYPDLIDRFELANGLVPEDGFIDFYLGEQRRHADRASAN